MTNKTKTAGNTKRGSLIREMGMAHDVFSDCHPTATVLPPRPGSSMSMHGVSATPLSTSRAATPGVFSARVSAAQQQQQHRESLPTPTQHSEAAPNNPLTPEVWDELLRSRLVAPLGWSKRPAHDCSVPVLRASRPSSRQGPGEQQAGAQKGRRANEGKYRDEFKQDRIRTARVYGNAQSAGGPPVLLYSYYPAGGAAARDRERWTPSPTGGGGGAAGQGGFMESGGGGFAPEGRPEEAGFEEEQAYMTHRRRIGTGSGSISRIVILPQQREAEARLGWGVVRVPTHPRPCSSTMRRISRSRRTPT